MGAPSARVHELARQWAQAGHHVTVLTAFPHHPVGRKLPADRGALYRREACDGIDVVRTYVYATPNQGTAKRMLSYASFMASAALLAPWSVQAPDIVVATSPQLLAALAGYVIAKIKHAPFVFEVRDLWPESIVAISAMPEGVAVRGLRGLARFLYRAADHIVTVGEGYKRGIISGYAISENKISVIPNGIDREMFTPGPRHNSIREQYGWKDKFVLLYLGTHGLSHGLETVLDAADRLRDEADLVFVFVGEGAEKARLQRRAADLRLSNVLFIDQQPRQRVPLFYAACDVGIVTLRNVPLFQEVLPSKMFEYLAMQRPLLLSVDGEARALVEGAQAGLFVPPDNPQALVSAIRALRDRPEQLIDMGQRGRQYVLEHHDRAELAARYVTLLRDVVAQRPKPG
jgi:glycosyltransferase involved in cell wall biosynthesis